MAKLSLPSLRGELSKIKIIINNLDHILSGHDVPQSNIYRDRTWTTICSKIESIIIFKTFLYGGKTHLIYFKRRTGPKSKSSIFYVHLMRISYRVEIPSNGVGGCNSYVLCLFAGSSGCHNVKHFNWTAGLRNEWKKSRNWSLLCHKSHPANNY